MFESILNLSLIAVSLFGTLTLVSLTLFCIRLKRRRMVSATLQLPWLALYGLGTIGAIGFGANFYTYHQLSFETSIARVSFHELQPQKFQVRLQEQNSDQIRHYELRGDAWQVDARVVKWETSAQWLGLTPLYRLERISGRYQDIDNERNAPRSVYQLNDTSPLDIDSLVQRYQAWLPWKDAFYGSATYLPMSDGAEYEISLSQSGLIARPTNAAAISALQKWH